MKISATIIILFSLLNAAKTFGQDMYACFVNDENRKLQLSVYFDKNNKAAFVKYKGQTATIPLVYSKIKTTKNSGGIPAVYWAETYNEKYNGVITGQYIFTNAGTRGLDVTYVRKRDGKKFYFSILEGSQDSDNTTFRSRPCF